MFCTYIRIEWKILVFRKTAFHIFPKSVYPTPLLTLKQRLNGAQTQAVFLYFSILNSERKHLYLCPCKVSQIMMPFFQRYIKPHLVFFANEMMKCISTTIVATLRKYDRPTLVEEVEGRVFHTVTIQKKCLTRSKKRLSDLETKVDAIFSVSMALALR